MLTLRATKKLLQGLQDNWNPKYWLWCTGDSIGLMKVRKDGTRAMTEDGGVDPDYTVESYDIDSDGGAW